MVTISVHNGTTVCRAHNLRLPGVTKSQSHIDPNGVYEAWHDESEIAAYKRLFQDAVDYFNAKQTRGDRIIRSYHTKIAQSGQQKTSYELIVGVYGSDCNPKTGYRILRAYYDDWKRRNPRLEIIGAYYHADESGDPHIHLDYVPVGCGYTTGMETRASLRRALEQQGFTKNDRETAQIAWERSERDFLESLCVAHGLTVDHPGGHKKHLSVSEYKAERDDERYRTITASAVELHEKKALGSGRVTVDADGLKILKGQARAYMIQQSEPSLRTRSALAAQRQSTLLKKESELSEREKALEVKMNAFQQDQRQWEREQDSKQVTYSALSGLLDDIADTLRDVINRYPMPQPLQKVLSSVIRKIEKILSGSQTVRISRESERE